MYCLLCSYPTREATMAIVRFEPGTAVPQAGTYALVGHYGEPLGRWCWRDAGERLPPTASRDETEGWYVWIAGQVLARRPTRHGTPVAQR